MDKKPTKVEGLKAELKESKDRQYYWKGRFEDADESRIQLMGTVKRLEKQIDDRKWLEAEYVAEQKRAEYWRGVALGMDPEKAMLIERGPDV